MRTTNPSAIELFCLLGMLPGGVTEQDLNSLWEGNNSNLKDWVFLAEELKNYSLLVEKIETENELTKLKRKYMLSVPFMNRYAESLLRPFELRQF